MYSRKAFRDELALLQKIRHPNVVQFLGAVTQSTPMMIVTEYLPKVNFSLESQDPIKLLLVKLPNIISCDLMMFNLLFYHNSRVGITLSVC